MVEYLPYKQRVIGSSPITPTRKEIQSKKRLYFLFRKVQYRKGVTKARTLSCHCLITPTSKEIQSKKRLYFYFVNFSTEKEFQGTNALLPLPYNSHQKRNTVQIWAVFFIS